MNLQTYMEQLGRLGRRELTLFFYGLFSGINISCFSAFNNRKFEVVVCNTQVDYRLIDWVCVKVYYRSAWFCTFSSKNFE